MTKDRKKETIPSQRKISDYSWGVLAKLFKPLCLNSTLQFGKKYTFTIKNNKSELI